MSARRASRAEAVRGAVEHTFTLAAGGAHVTRELVDELTGAAARLRGALEDRRPTVAEELQALAARLDALEGRLAALEGGSKTRPRRTRG